MVCFRGLDLFGFIRLIGWFLGVLRVFCGWNGWKIGVLVKKMSFLVKKTRKPDFFSHHNSGWILSWQATRRLPHQVTCCLLILSFFKKNTNDLEKNNRPKSTCLGFKAHAVEFSFLGNFLCFFQLIFIF
jgi:hypothetical protein